MESVEMDRDAVGEGSGDRWSRVGIRRKAAPCLAGEKRS